MLITSKHVNTESFIINVSRNRIERALTYKYLGVIVDAKLTWKEHCKQLCSTISKYIGVAASGPTIWTSMYGLEPVLCNRLLIEPSGWAQTVHMFTQRFT